MTDHAFGANRVSWLEMASENSRDAIYHKDLNGRYVQINQAGADYLGLAVEEVIGKTDTELFSPEDASDIEEQDQRVLTTGLAQWDETRVQCRSSQRTFSTHRIPYRTNTGNVLGLIGISRDITEMRAAQDQANAVFRRLQGLLASITDAFYALDHEGTFTYLNTSAERLLGRPASALLGQRIWTLFSPETHSRFHQQLELAANKGVPVEFDEYSPLNDHWYEVHVYPSVDGLSVLMSDVTLRRRAEEELERANMELERRVRERTAELEQLNEQLQHDALHDAMTGLPNRTLLLDRLGRAVERAVRSPDTAFATMLLDLDGFQAINSNFGFTVGDNVLRELALRMQHGLRTSDTLARLSGDEFILLLEDKVSLKMVQAVAARLMRAVQAPFIVAGQTLYLTVSIGLLLNTPDHLSAQDVLRDADLAKRQAKTLGKAGLAMFTPELKERERSLRALEEDLRLALKRQELSVHYQPIVDLNSGRLKGFEALVRWNHPAHGQVSPAEFIPVAERMGLIVEVDRLVLRMACRDWHAWQRTFPALRELTLSVNLSAMQFSRAHLARDLKTIVLAYGLVPEQLQLELTESSLLQVTDASKQELTELRRLGFRLAMDDFGTGYSSLSSLQQLPVDTLKIDRSFISGTAHQPGIVQAIVTMAHTLGLSVVAEGIETDGQLAELLDLGCEAGQGYLFSRPLPAEQILKVLDRTSWVSQQNSQRVQ